nr:MAG TPA: hypothetical protein [Microviridae sp.]
MRIVALPWHSTARLDEHEVSEEIPRYEPIKPRV